MKKKNHVFKISIWIVFMFISGLSFGQLGHQHRGEHMLGMFDHLKEALQLSEEQIVQIEGLQDELKQQLMGLKDQDFESREAHFEAVKAIKESVKTKLGSILNEDQLNKLEEIKKARHDHRKEKFADVDWEGLKSEVQAFKETVVLPVLLEKRAELELTTTDEEQLNTIRTALADLPRAKQGFFHLGLPPFARHSKSEKRFPELTSEQKEAIKQLKELTEKYSVEIRVLLEELAPQKEAWRTQMKAIMVKYLPEKPTHDTEQQSFPGKRPRDKKRMGPRGNTGERQGASHFLLLDPNKTIAIMDEPTPISMEIYPNPSSVTNTLTYKINQAGWVKVELRRENGTLINVLVDDQHQEGDYNMYINTEQLNDGTYYITIISEQGSVSTQKMVVSR